MGGSLATDCVSNAAAEETKNGRTDSRKNDVVSIRVCLYPGIEIVMVK